MKKQKEFQKNVQWTKKRGKDVIYNIGISICSFSLFINLSNLSTTCLWIGHFGNNLYIIFVSVIIGGILQTDIQIQELVKKEKIDEKRDLLH
jgi:hypothetical protein